MQLSREELSKLDLIIERYSEDETIKEASTIKEYLNTHPAKIQELLITVYFNLSRKPTEEESKIIDEHKTNLFNLLSEKGYIKSEETRTTKTTEQRLNNDKKQKLFRYRDLREQLYQLYNTLDELNQKQKHLSHIQATDYSKEKIQRSKQKYEFKAVSLLSEIEDTEKYIEELEKITLKEKEYLSSVIRNISDLRVRHIYWWRYLMVEEWKEVARMVGLKSQQYCIRLHNEYLNELEI
jgi:hypothetical protein